MIIQQKNFNLRHIADSGQCFRMNQIGDKKYSLIAFGKYLELTEDASSVHLSCSEEEYEAIWRDYFDMDYPYDSIVDSLLLGKDQFLKEAARFGSGLRILKQDIFETLISFIISQRKNIPAIKASIEQLCTMYGEEKTSPQCNGKTYYAFPTPTKLAGAAIEDLRKAGLGYRDKYIKETSQAVYRGEIPLEELKELDFDASVKKLLTLSGVGIKVANCVALYGLHHIEAFPVDVWIERVLKDVYQNTFKQDLYQGFAGIIQQYMFYYIRNSYRQHKGKTPEIE